MKYKKCSKCKEEKSIRSFWKRKDRPSGYLSACKDCLKTESKKYRDTEEHREYDRKRNLKRRYGVDYNEYIQLHNEQEGRCKICTDFIYTERNSDNQAVVDHDHETGEVRGLLCRDCNTGIGMLKDDANILESAIKYLSSN
jgi:hypothetical protein